MTSDCVPDNCLLLGSLCSPFDRMIARSSASDGSQSRFNVTMVSRIATDEHARRSYYSSCNRSVRAPMKSVSDNEMWYGATGRETCQRSPTRCLYTVREINDTNSHSTCRPRQNCTERQNCTPTCFYDDEIYEREIDLPIDKTFVSPAEFKKYHPPRAKCREAPAVPPAMSDYDGRSQYYKNKGNTHWMIVPPGLRFRTCYPQVWDSTDVEAGGTRYDEDQVRCVKKQWRGENDRFITSPRYRYQTSCNVFNDTCFSAPLDVCGNTIVDTCCKPRAKTTCCTPLSSLKKKSPRKICSAKENSTNVDEIVGKPLSLSVEALSAADKIHTADDCKSRPKVLVLTEKSDDNKCGYPKTLVLWETVGSEANVNFSSNLYTVFSEYGSNDSEASAAMNRSNSAKHAGIRISKTNKVVYHEHILNELLRQLSILERDHEQMDEFLFKVLSRDSQESAVHNYSNNGPAILPIIKLEGEIIPEFSPPPSVENNERSKVNVESHICVKSDSDQSNISRINETADIQTAPEFSPVNITVRSTPTAQQRPLHSTSCRYPETVFIRRRRKSKAVQLKSRSSCRKYEDCQKGFETTSSSSSSGCEIVTNDKMRKDYDLSDRHILNYRLNFFTDTSDTENRLATGKEKHCDSKQRRSYKSTRLCKTSGSDSESWPSSDVVFSEWYNSHLKPSQPIWQTLDIESIGSSKTFPECLKKPTDLIQGDKRNVNLVNKFKVSDDLKDMMNRNWNANDVNPSSSTKQSRASGVDVSGLQKFRTNNVSQNSQSRNSGSSIDENDLDDGDTSGNRVSIGSSPPDDDLQDLDSEVDEEMFEERMNFDDEYRTSVESLGAFRRVSSVYNSLFPEKKTAETSVHKPSVRISLPDESDVFTTLGTKVEESPKPAGHLMGAVKVSESSGKSSQSSAKEEPTSSAVSQHRLSSKLYDIPTISLSGRFAEKQLRASVASNVKSGNSTSSVNTEIKEQHPEQYQEQQKEQSKLVTERALREFASILVKQLYAAIKEKTDRNLNEDKAIPEQRMKFIKEKIDEEIQVCLLPLLVDHIIWLIRQDLDSAAPDDERWFEKVGAEMIEDYIDLVVTNTTLVAHEQVEGRLHTKSFVAASNCHCNLVDMIEKFNKHKPNNATP